ncbi:alpha/beta fold hydrolase [Rhodococcoides fascians A21d2]|uniref:lipase family protein n=1 Tax=Nocardiaceae TaxID=85025 RepID=UPI000569F274|nr:MULTISPECIES: lipase family protein [Rhodococcus]OZC47933.1 lipase [Rhodococcus sp. WWJCD1]QII02968.1 alpha/beta fold hydrolase [Rhodococcus fascians A21d2]
MRYKRVFGSAVAVAAVIIGVTAPAVSAAPSTGSTVESDFYVPPSPLPAGSPGDVIRSEPSHLALSVPGIGGPLPGAATRIMYRSTDSNDAPNAVTGTYIDPAAEWTGPGPRPLVVLAPGTQGQGDQCAPSKMLNNVITYTPPLGFMVEYEVLAAYSLLSQGYGVVITDYEGLGTPGAHTYVNRASEAHAVLDAARAAQKLQGTKISGDGPVAAYGYSQGGGAAAAAAELADDYAPEMNLVGTYAGAPPADLKATLEQVDGTILTGVIGYTLNGLLNSDPGLRPIVDENINDAGKAMLNLVANQCVGETILNVGLHRTNEYTKTGEPLSVVLDRLPVAQEILAKNKIGERTPNAPVLIQSGTSDDIVPHGQAVGLAGDWCGKGATVQLSSAQVPAIVPGSGAGHLIPDILGLGEAQNWIKDRFYGVPAPSNC